ncbi:MAG: hypothetical protein HQK54_04900 [Oligoflexales bacterium]|nr:hypothetical protein [Oligoflexales bacterium]
MRCLLLLSIITNVFLPSCVADYNGSDELSFKGDIKAETKLPRKRHTLSFFDNNLKLSIASNTRPEKVRQDDAMYRFAASIGSKRNVECFAARKQTFPGTNMYQLYQQKFGENSQIRNMPEIYINSINGIPFAVMKVQYEIGCDNDQNMYKYGFVKLHDYVLICEHNELGYDRTFQRFMLSTAKSAFESYQSRELVKKLTYKTYSLNQVIGFKQVYTWKSGQLNHEEIIDSVIIPFSNKEIRTSDTYKLTTMNSYGELVSSVFESYQNDQQIYNIKVMEKGGNRLLLEGFNKNELIKKELTKPDFGIYFDVGMIPPQYLGNMADDKIAIFDPSLNSLAFDYVTFEKGNDRSYRITGREKKFIIKINRKDLVQNIHVEGKGLSYEQRLVNFQISQSRNPVAWSRL